MLRNMWQPQLDHNITGEWGTSTWKYDEGEITFSVSSARVLPSCARQLQKPQEFYVKSSYWMCPHAASILGLTHPQIRTDHANYKRVVPRHPATASMPCFICAELLIQTHLKFGITTVRNQMKVARIKHINCFCHDVITGTVRFPPYWKS